MCRSSRGVQPDPIPVVVLAHVGDYPGDNCQRSQATHADTQRAYQQLAPPLEVLPSWSRAPSFSLTRKRSLVQSQYRPPVQRYENAYVFNNLHGRNLHGRNLHVRSSRFAYSELAQPQAAAVYPLDMLEGYTREAKEATMAKTLIDVDEQQLAEAAQV